MARIVMRKPAVLGATGWSNSTLYQKIKTYGIRLPFRD